MSSKELLFQIEKNPIYKHHQKQRWFRLFVGTTLGIILLSFLSKIPLPDSMIVFDFFLVSSILLFFYFFILLCRKPKVFIGTIKQSSSVKLPWLQAKQGKEFQVIADKNEYKAHCLYGVTYGVEKEYQTDEDIYLLLYPEPYIIKKQGV